jgi:hypothetical protein
VLSPKKPSDVKFMKKVMDDQNEEIDFMKSLPTDERKRSMDSWAQLHRSARSTLLLLPPLSDGE